MSAQPDNHAISRKIETSYGAAFIKSDPEKDLAHYDVLPKAIREALDDAPWGISAVATMHYLRAHGLVSTLKEIKDSADSFYAAFEKETGVPRPVKPIGKGMGVKTCRR